MQALIDTGERDYPEHLAAATFTDTFSVADNANIKLFNNGTGVFKNNVYFEGTNAVSEAHLFVRNNKFSVTMVYFLLKMEAPVRIYLQSTSNMAKLLTQLNRI